MALLTHATRVHGKDVKAMRALRQHKVRRNRGGWTAVPSRQLGVNSKAHRGGSWLRQLWRQDQWVRVV